MILAVMSLEQWIDANQLMDTATQTLQPEALQTALATLQTTQIRVLLLTSDERLLHQFMAFVDSNLSTLDGAEKILALRQVIDDTQDAYIDAIRTIHRQDLGARSVVSFISSVQQIDEFTNLSYHNPGQDFRHYHAWVAAYLPIHPTKHTVVMPLGEVVPQDRAKAVAVFIPIAQHQKPEIEVSTLVAKMQSLFAEQEKAPDGHIYQFKMGTVEESIFDTRMISCIAEQIGIHLTEAQFNQIWQATNPSFSTIETRLNQVSAQEVRRAGYEFEFVSYTNPKDMTRLAGELHQHDQAYVLAKGQLIGLAGLRLSCSFLEQKSVLDMIQDLVSSASYAQSMRLVQSPHKLRANDVYFVTSATTLPENLTAMHRMPNVHVLLGWDGSPVHEWVSAQLTSAEEFDSKYASSMV